MIDLAKNLFIKNDRIGKYTEIIHNFMEKGNRLELICRFSSPQPDKGAAIEFFHERSQKYFYFKIKYFRIILTK